MSHRNDDDNYEEDEEEEYDYEDDDQKPKNDDKFSRFNEIAGKSNNLKVKPVTNDHYDMAYDLNESVAEESMGHNNKNQQIGVHHNHNVDKLNYKKDEEDEDEGEDSNNFEYPAKMKGNDFNPPQNTNNYSKLPRFDISEFRNLDLGADGKELMNIMNKFTYNEVQLDTKLKPYIPSYIPSIGEVDAFLKMSRPDNLLDELGLSVLDEPTISGVDPSIFSLELSYKLKLKVPSNFIVKSIENAEKNPQKIQNWVDQISNLHKEKMTSSVSYSKLMPNIESLMQLWPEKMESAFKDIKMPGEELNMNLENYSMILCNLMDIPIHTKDSNKAIIEALHVLFTLYSEFKENQHFQREKKPEVNVQSMKF